MKNTKAAINLTILAYHDYIASRHLLNSGFYLQGAVLASSAVEKYLKVILVMQGAQLNKIRIHLDRLPKLKAHFQGTEYIELFDKHFDELFFGELSKAYMFRYYDNITQPTTLGFFPNQFLGELDHTVHLIESLLVMEQRDGTNIDTFYKRAVKNHEIRLFENNFILNGIDKKIFMESSSFGFGIYYNPITTESFYLESKMKHKVPYPGKIFLIDVLENVKNSL